MRGSGVSVATPRAGARGRPASRRRPRRSSGDELAAVLVPERPVEARLRRAGPDRRGEDVVEERVHRLLPAPEAARGRQAPRGRPANRRRSTDARATTSSARPSSAEAGGADVHVARSARHSSRPRQPNGSAASSAARPRSSSATASGRSHGYGRASCGESPAAGARAARAPARSRARHGAGPRAPAETRRAYHQLDGPNISSPPMPVSSEPPARPRSSARGSARCTARAGRGAQAPPLPPGRRSRARPSARCGSSRRGRDARRPAPATPTRPSSAERESCVAGIGTGRPSRRATRGDGEHGRRVPAAREADDAGGSLEGGKDDRSNASRGVASADATRCRRRVAEHEAGRHLERATGYGKGAVIAGTRISSSNASTLSASPSTHAWASNLSSSRRTPITISRGSP